MLKGEKARQLAEMVGARQHLLTDASKCKDDDLEHEFLYILPGAFFLLKRSRALGDSWEMGCGPDATEFAIKLGREMKGRRTASLRSRSP